MDVFYVLMHREAGPLFTAMSFGDVAREMVAVLADEPSWREDLTLERFQLIVAPARHDAHRS